MSKRGFSTAAPKKATPAKRAKPITPTPSWSLLPASYQLFRDNFVIAFFILIVPTLLLQVGATLPQVTTSAFWYNVALYLQFLACIILLANVAASIVLQLRLVRGQPVSFYTVYRDSWRYWLRIAGFSLLFALMLVVGFILFIVPGLIALRRYVLTPYFLVEEDLGIRRAMQRSQAASDPITKHIWTMLLIIFGFGGLGFIGTKLSPEYGGFVAALLPIIYSLLPALRYKEATHNLNLATKE